MRTLYHLTALCLLSLLWAGPVLGQGVIVIDDGPITVVPPQPWPRAGRMELREHQVNVDIHDQVATTTVEHIFYNPTSQQLEGHFLFPLPPGAQVDQVLMDINGEQVEAELLDAGKARRTYEDIVRRLRDPALLEYCDAGLIRAHIFPIEPHSEKRITITYTHLLPSEGGLVRYEYPLVDHRVEGRDVTHLAMKIELQTTGPLTTLYSPTHELEITRQGKHRATVGLETSEKSTSGGVQLFFATQQKSDDLVLSLLTYNDGREDGYFLLLASPPPQDEHAKALSKTVIFVLDTSGSMSGEKLAQAKRALRFCLDNLNANDRFQLICFATDVESLFDEPVQATAAHRKEAAAFVDNLKAVGGTAIYDALGKAMHQVERDSNAVARYIVFLTDGKPTVGQTNPDAIVKMIAQRADHFRERVFCFGIGTHINTKLLDHITQTTRAASEYVLPEEDLEMKLSNFYAKINRPALANPVLKVDGVTIDRLQPADLPDLFQGEQLVIFGRYQNHGDATLTVEGQRGEKTEAFERDVTFARKNTAHSSIPRMWATRRVGELLDAIRLHGESKKRKKEVVALARKFGIITPYTSYLIVEDEQQRRVPMAMQTLPQVSQDAAMSEALAGAYVQMKDADTGRAGIAANRLNNQLSQASVAQPAQVVMPGDSAKAQTAVAVQTVNERTFVQHGKQWIDTQVQQLEHPHTRQITFASDDYFALLHDHPEVSAWLSIGRNVTFQLGDEVIEIVSESDD